MPIFHFFSNLSNAMEVVPLNYLIIFYSDSNWEEFRPACLKPRDCHRDSSSDRHSLDPCSQLVLEHY